MPKGKNNMVGEDSSLATDRELELIPKVELVIKMSQKKPHVLPPSYKDIDTNIVAKVSMPT
jgi:hypothetical protein